MREFGLIGKTLQHSFSAKYFNDKFQNEGITDCNYQLFELENIEDIRGLISNSPNLQGFNITIPYKESIIPYLDVVDDVVREIGACNCVKIINGKLHGFNTDVIGFMISILPLIEPQHHSAIILGNGGSSKAVIYALEQMSIDHQVIARNARDKNEILWQDINKALIEEHKVIINTTPLGMWPKVDDFPNIPYEAIDRFHLAFDLIYNPTTTKFLEKADAQDAEIKNGMEMLTEQAEAAWGIWMED